MADNAQTSHAVRTKRVLHRLYILRTTVGALDPEQRRAIGAAEALLPDGSRYELVRLDDDGSVCFLNYPSFFTAAFPPLAQSWKVRADLSSWAYRDFRSSDNPPIFHRRELLLPAEHPTHAAAAALTAELELIGAFDRPPEIGTLKGWQARLSELGYQISAENTCLPIGNETAFGPHEPCGSPKRASMVNVQRHRTALARASLSAPLQLLLRFSLIRPGETTFLDYGCGRGTDLEAVHAMGVEGAGWDPHFRPEGVCRDADVVNLGFVLNVIEDPAERLLALRRAWSFARTVLAVAVMPPSDTGLAQPYSDGYLTSRNTFQKYFHQHELKQYLWSALDREVNLVASGIAFVFRDEVAEQRFLLTRVGRRSGDRQPSRLPVHFGPPRPRANARTSVKSQRGMELRTLLEPVWLKALDLGRLPDQGDLSFAPPVEVFGGSYRRLTTAVSRLFPPDDLAFAAQGRKDTILAMLALRLFERRRSFTDLDQSLKRDLQLHFGGLAQANKEARELLVQIASRESIQGAIIVAVTAGVGRLVEQEGLFVDERSIADLPPLLRVLIGAAEALFGQPLDECQVVKVHWRSHKVSFLKFADFDIDPVPLLSLRIVVNLGNQTERVLRYENPDRAMRLVWKNRLLPKDLEYAESQKEFDNQLAGLQLFSDQDILVDSRHITRSIEENGKAVSGYQLIPRTTVPTLDSLCGRYFTYRSLIECGNTQTRVGISNIPSSPKSFNALLDLCRNVLDPVVDEFGRLEITYGFCSAPLSRLINARVDRTIDQHCAYEALRSGKLICERGGAAVDFIMQDIDMREVADWIIGNLPFDRLYFYGGDKPIHVSYGPEHSRKAWRMSLTRNGRRFPARY